MHKDTGCLSIFLSKSRSLSCFRRNNTTRHINIGSVGISKLKSIPGKNSFNGTENGTKKTDAKSTLSIERKRVKKRIMATGSKLNINESLVIIK
ncbi:MAG: hypothetical protein LBQ22_12480 [Bacteroidales bacterium]|nr:hypothetical protein [Bacteroidales bacterium]